MKGGKFMNKAILTFATGPFVKMQQMALPRIKHYAAKHGYDLHIGDGANPEGRPPSWSKVPMLQKYLLHYDACLWMDADLIIVDEQDDLANEVPKHAIQAVVCHYAHHCGTVPNFGLWYVKKEALPFVKLMWELEVFWDHVWWEQAAALTLLGYTGLESGHVRHLRQTKWTKSMHYLCKCWNSHPLDADANPKIVHCANPLPFSERLRIMQQYGEHK